jgi:hypothetical protein
MQDFPRMGARSKSSYDVLCHRTNDFKKELGYRLSLPRAEKTDVIHAQGEEWATFPGMVRNLGLEKVSLSDLLGRCRVIQGLDCKGIERKFFSVIDARKEFQVCLSVD